MDRTHVKEILEKLNEQIELITDDSVKAIQKVLLNLIETLLVRKRTVAC